MIPKSLIAAVLVTAVLTLVPSSAWGGLFQADVILGFGAGYSAADGSERTHRGVDVRCAPGDEVECPSAGVVHFAGAIPAASGGTVLAVSIDTAQGRVTLMPLKEIRVESGQVVAANDSVGTVADSGDLSSGATHVHMSLRNGELYLNPTPLLSATAGARAQGETSAQPGAAPVLAPATSQAPSPSPKAAHARVQAMGDGVSLSAESRAVDTPEAQNSRQPAGRVASAGSEVMLESRPMGEGVTLAPTRPGSVAPVSAGNPVAVRLNAPLDAVKTASRELIRSASPVHAPVGAPAYLTVLAALVCGALLLSLRAFERQFTADTYVSDRLGILLQQLRTGATLRGLTSCPGETAFTVPGPSSPGEVTK